MATDAGRAVCGIAADSDDCLHIEVDLKSTDMLIVLITKTLHNYLLIHQSVLPAPSAEILLLNMQRMNHTTLISHTQRA